MIEEQLGVTPREAFPPSYHPPKEDGLSVDFLQHLARLSKYENRVPNLRKRLLNARKFRLTTKKGQNLQEPKIQVSDVLYALKEILYGQEIQPIVKSQESDRSIRGVE